MPVAAPVKPCPPRPRVPSFPSLSLFLLCPQCHEGDTDMERGIPGMSESSLLMSFPLLSVCLCTELPLRPIDPDCLADGETDGRADVRTHRVVLCIKAPLSHSSCDSAFLIALWTRRPVPYNGRLVGAVSLFQLHNLPRPVPVYLFFITPCLLLKGPAMSWCPRPDRQDHND